jgi:hypothetical protein
VKRGKKDRERDERKRERDESGIGGKEREGRPPERKGTEGTHRQAYDV